MKAAYVCEQAEIDVSAHITTHLESSGFGGVKGLPDITLLKPRSLSPSPWVKENRTAEDIDIGEQGDRAVCMDCLGMDVKQVAAFAHTERKTYVQTLFAMTLARYVNGRRKHIGDIGTLFDTWTKETKMFPFSRKPKTLLTIAGRHMKTLDKLYTLDAKIKANRLRFMKTFGMSSDEVSTCTLLQGSWNLFSRLLVSLLGHEVSGA
jgi:hypothetical protein